MSKKFHSAYQNGVDDLSSNGLDDGATSGMYGLGALDLALCKLSSHAFATTQVPITQNGDTVEFGEIEIFHHRESDGLIIKNVVSAGTISLSNSSGVGNFAVATLSESDGGAASLAAMDYDGITTTSGLTKNMVVLFGRPPLSVRSQLHYVALKPAAPLQGTASLTNAGTTTTVTIGITMPSTHYHVLLCTSAANQRNPWVADSSRSTTQFTITHASATTGDTVFWMIVT